MALHLSSPVKSIAGIGEVAAKDLKNLGIRSIRDLLLYFPFRYEDYSKIIPIKQLKVLEPCTVEGKIVDIKARPSQKNPKLQFVEATVTDGTGNLKVIWFNQVFLLETLKPGTEIALAGKLDIKMGRAFISPVHEPKGARVHTGRIVPIYGLSGSLTMRRLRGAIERALHATKAEWTEWLPSHIIEQEQTLSFVEAIEMIHFPASPQMLDRAVERLKFDEVFLHQLMYARVRSTQKRAIATPFAVDVVGTNLKKSRLPFALTKGQDQALQEIQADLARPFPMNRLLQGDVGSGKTVVAALASAGVLAKGGTVVYLAPTELLAKQQHQAFAKFLDGTQVALLTGSQAMQGDKKVLSSEVKESIAQGKVHCIVGTHALLQEGVSFKSIDFIIIDEQHRFGVEQRHALLTTSKTHVPHLLSMTATPIPRSLGLTLYGDLDVSTILERPAGRKPITTVLVTADKKQAMWAHIQKEIQAKHQVYIVCPLIEVSDQSESKSVEEVVQKLKKSFLAKANIAALHGKMKSEDKQKLISEFREGSLDILVATTVVEVGVDIPQATIILIVDAERFGLAQLHQLRGRVGRNSLDSFCYLMPNELTETSQTRLQALVQCQDGFTLAEEDLKLRGPGNLFGNAQSGLPDFKLATPSDFPLMKKARTYATHILATDPDLALHPLLANRVTISLEQAHLE